jgi:hypothetical protein
MPGAQESLLPSGAVRYTFRLINKQSLIADISPDTEDPKGASFHDSPVPLAAFWESTNYVSRETGYWFAFHVAL